MNGALLDGRAIAAWAHSAVAELHRARGQLDATNVYPVADADTGTNLLLTVESAAAALSDQPGSVGDALAELAKGALAGARGNSGVILSEFLRGCAEQLADLDLAGAGDLAAALTRGAELAWAAVARPVEGTILSVARSAAGAATGAAATTPSGVAATTPADVLSAAVAAGAEELARSPDRLPALGGVVDAGGRGLLLVLGCLARAAGADPAALTCIDAVPAGPAPGLTQRETGSSDYGYEVQYLLEADAAALPPLRARLAAIGDSLVVVGADRDYHVHVHVNDVGAAIEAGIEAGRPHHLSVTRFADQLATTERRRRVLAFVPAGATGARLRAAGAEVGPTHTDPSGPPGELVILPNARELRDRAEELAARARDRGHTVVVIPTRSPVQALAAMAVHDPARRFDEDVAAMSAAAAATRTGALCIAQTAAQTSAGRCRPGDVLGLIDDDVAVIGAEPTETAAELLDRMLAGGGELVTLLRGQLLPTELTEALATHLAQRWPAVELSILDGGQADTLFLVGVE